MQPSIEPLGDTAAIVAWGEVPAESARAHVRALADVLRARNIAGIGAVVPAFASLTVHYDPCNISWDGLTTSLRQTCRELTFATPLRTQHIEIPVCYDLEFGVDLPELAGQHQLSIEQVVQLHATAEYIVQMIGFSPGFPYLSGLPRQLETARRKTPRLKVPAGSVAIGGNQTGVYTLETPGGWNIIGRTPIELFQPQKDPPCLLSAGDRVQFSPISRSDFLRQRG